jgi:hypothetical protein
VEEDMIKNVPPQARFTITEHHKAEKGYTAITLWDTTNTEILDCWIIEDYEDYKKCEKELEELFL